MALNETGDFLCFETKDSQKLRLYEGFAVLTAVLLKIKVSWCVTPCHLANFPRRFEGIKIHHKHCAVLPKDTRHITQDLNLRLFIVHALPILIHYYPEIAHALFTLIYFMAHSTEGAVQIYKL
jgi:hypothetical protein